MTPRVLLVSMPFVGCERPSLGLSLLRAQLERRRLPCDVRYLTFSLADRLGAENYDWVSNVLPYTAFVGDWVFARSLHGPDPDSDRDYVRRVLVGEWRLGRTDVERIYAIRQQCEAFLEACLDDPGWTRYDLVGFTSTFTQNVASLALARRLEERHQHLRIVFGGANWDGEMGEALHAAFPFVDFVCRGEADESFPALVEALGAREGERDLASIPGIVYRENGRTVATDPPRRVEDLDALPRVRFDDYYRDWRASACRNDVAPRPLLETSRGCWWGEKSHCVFCGLNANGMAFRSKSADRVLDEIRDLGSRYDTVDLEVVDNILDMRYFQTLLPRLRDEGPDVRLFYEVKANLGLEQVRLLRDAGVLTIQPGIESLSDRVLKLMRKGTTALQNVQLLKWCRELGIQVEWNLLYGFPGERAADYLEMVPLLQAIRFLDPPSGHGPVRLDRFSPYHADPGAFGMTDVRPLAPYRHLYPNVGDDERMRIAYYFDYEVDEKQLDPEAPSAIARVLEEVRSWRSHGAGGGLHARVRSDGAVHVSDRRADRPYRDLALRDFRARVYLACDRVTSRASLRRRVAPEVPAEELDAFLGLMTRLGLMVRSGERYLALALRNPPRYRGEQEVADAGRSASLPHHPSPPTAGTQHAPPIR